MVIFSDRGKLAPASFRSRPGSHQVRETISKPPSSFVFAARALCRARSFGAVVGLAAALAGCAAGPAPAPAVRPLMVQVPVLHQTPCPVPVLKPPALPIAGLKPGSPPADTMRAYAASVAILKGAVRERDAVLGGCARAGQAVAAQAEKTQ